MPPKTTTHRICITAELPIGERKIVDIAGKSIGVFNVNGEYHAIRNACPHQLAPLCLGKVSGTTLPSDAGEYNYGHEGEIIRCPWHGWEFDLKTGRSVFNPHRCRVKSYPVSVEHSEEQTTEQPHAQTESPDTQTKNVALSQIQDPDKDPAVDHYAVTIDGDWVVLHV